MSIEAGVQFLLFQNISFHDSRPACPILNRVSLLYSCEKDLILNQRKLDKHFFYLTNVSAAFYFKGELFEDYFILSNQPMPRLPYLDDVGLQVIEKLWKRGVIILPINEETRTWIMYTTWGIGL